MQRIEIEYDSFSRVSTIESLDDETSGVGSVVNSVTYSTRRSGRCPRCTGDMDGVASTNGTSRTETVSTCTAQPNLTMTACRSRHNFSRLDDLVYPSDSTGSPTVTVKYGTTGSTNDKVSRDGFDADDIGVLVLYEHVGWDRVAEVDYAAPGRAELDRTFSHEGKRNTQGYSSQSAGLYPGWDRFGRVRVQAGSTAISTKRSGQGTDEHERAGHPADYRGLHLYDRASNRLEQDRREARRGVPTATDTAYDSLDRLTEAGGARGATPTPRRLDADRDSRGQQRGVDVRRGWATGTKL